ncbi:MAG TPA: VanZ family protein [Gammaproteobacteria bacterium]
MPLRLAPLWWSLGAFFVVIDVALSLAPPGDGPALLPDKLVHFTTYFLLASWFVSLVTRRRGIALAGVILLGGVLEILQGMTPARQPEWLDFLANTSGATLAFAVIVFMPVNLFAWFERKAGIAKA